MNEALRYGKWEGEKECSENTNREVKIKSE